MALDDFLGEGRREGSDRSNQDRIRDYRAAKLLASLLKYKDMKLEDMMLNMAYEGKDIVIVNNTGYHYGRFLGYDGKRFYLDNYRFDRRLIDECSYIESTFAGPKVAIPADNLISVGEIPDFIDEPAYA